MPQFDKVTFFGQIFWFTVIFAALFFYVTYTYVPYLSLYSKIQQKILKFNTKSFDHVILTNTLMANSANYYKKLLKNRLTLNTVFYKTTPVTANTLWENFNVEQKNIYLANLNLTVKNTLANSLLK